MSLLKEGLSNATQCIGLTHNETAHLIAEFINFVSYGDYYMFTPSLNEVVWTHCPSLLTMVTCQLEFMKKFPDCYDEAYYIKTIKQQEAVVDIMKYICDSGAERLISFTKSFGQYCILRVSHLLEDCINDSNLDGDPKPYEDSSYMLSEYTGKERIICK